MDGGKLSSLFSVNVTGTVGAEYAGLIDDLLRMLCIQLTIQTMLFFSGDVGGAFITREFLLLLIYVEMGVLLYWLVIKKLVKFT